MRTLGDTAEETAEQLTAKDYLQIQQDGIDKIVDKLNEEKDAMNEVLDSLNDQTRLKIITTLRLTLLKPKTRKESATLNFKKSKRLWTMLREIRFAFIGAAKGFTIQEDSEAVAKAQDELDKAIND